MIRPIHETTQGRTMHRVGSGERIGMLLNVLLVNIVEGGCCCGVGYKNVAFIVNAQAATVEIGTAHKYILVIDHHRLGMVEPIAWATLKPKW